MKPRSSKYYQKRKEESGEKKGSVTDADYNEENQTTTEQAPKKNPAPSKSHDLSKDKLSDEKDSLEKLSS